MVVKNEFFRSQFFYFIRVILLIFVCINIQSVFLSQFSSHWLHVDFISIIIAYLAFEHHIFFAAFHALIAGALMQIYSSSPNLFFMLYFMSIVTSINLLLQFFVVSSVFSKNLIFILIYALKYILFYYILNSQNNVNFSLLLFVYWKEYLSTILSSFFIYKLLILFDIYFGKSYKLKKVVKSL